MSLNYYIDLFSQLKMNPASGHKSPHKVCMLLAVMDLVEVEKIQINQIHYNQLLKDTFTRHFELLRQGNDQNTPQLPFYHLRTSKFWHHKIFSGSNEKYEYLKNSFSESKMNDSIEFVELDPELFEYLKSYNAREVLRHALSANLNEELRYNLLNPLQGWSWGECEKIVEDYFSMLEAEIKGEKYVKTHHREALAGALNNRTDASIEMKHRNISAVLSEMGMPVIDGYKPLPNYQRNILPDVIGAQLAQHKNVTKLIEAINNKELEQVPSVDNILQRMVEAPDHKEKVVKDSAAKYEGKTYRPYKVNYLDRDARNQKLGLLGEEFILNYEKARLIFEGRASLADRIEHVSLQDDAKGFDLHSYDTNGQDRFVEVKTTLYARYTQFYVTPNELRTSKQHDKYYHLYRVFNFHKDPHFYTKQGDLEKSFSLQAASYLATA